MASEEMAFLITARDRASAIFRKVAGNLDGVRDKQDRVTKASREYSAVSQRLTGLEDKHADALGRERVALQRLTEMRSRANAKTSQIARAEEQLLKARRDSVRAAANVSREIEKAATPDGAKSGRSFTSGFRKWLTGQGLRDMHDAGKLGGTVFGSGLAGAISTPGVGPAIVASLLALAATVGPAVGAVLGGAVVSAFGLGLAGLGLVFAAKAKNVQTVWKRVLGDMGAQMRILSVPFEKTLLVMAAVVRRTFGALKPALAGAFKGLAPAVAEFSDQLGRAFEKFGPAIKPLSEAFSAVLKSLGPGLVSVIGNISTALIRLSDSIKKNPTALADFVKGIGDLVGDLLKFLTIANNADAAFKRFTGGMSLVTFVLGGVRVALGLILGPIEAVAKGLGFIGDKMNWLAGKLHLGKQATDEATGSNTTFSDSLLTTATSLQTVAPPVDTLTAKYNRQVAATDVLISNLNRLSGIALTLSGAQIGMAQAVADATAAIKTNGHTLDLSTQRGRDNQRALNAVAAAANDQRDAMLRANKGNAAAAASALQSRATFVRLATQMGLSKSAAKALAVQLIHVPSVQRTVSVETAAAQRKAAALQAQIDHMHGKVVTVSVNTYRNLIETHIDRGLVASGSGLPGRAAGGPVFAGRPYIVGEKRPEIFVPKVNGTIVPKVPTATSGLARSGGSGGPVVNNFNFDLGGAIIASRRDAEDWLTAAITNLKRKRRF